MTDTQLQHLHNAFDDYVSSYEKENEKLAELHRLKIKHSHNVAEEALQLSNALAWSKEDQRTARAIGLVHDIGRFHQLEEYQTFSDLHSFDHGEYGWEILKNNGFLDFFHDKEHDVVLESVCYHNCRVLPKDLSSKALPFVKLLRDCDKLDIYRVVLDALETDGFKDLPDMMPNISLDKSPSPEILREILNNKNPSTSGVKSLGDFLLIQMSWIYGLNFPRTIQQVIDRDILSRLKQQIALQPDIECTVDKIFQDTWQLSQTKF